MGISLTKGGNVSLTKMAPTLDGIRVGLGWDPRTTTGAEFDLDASALVCGENDKVISNDWFIFYNQLQSPDASVRHTGDVLDGAAAGDDETVEVDLGRLPAEAQRIVFCATIHDADARGQNFGQVSNAYIRVVNRLDQAEMARYDLSEDAAVETAMVFGELYKNGSEWKFRAVGQGYASGLTGIITDYGVSL